MQILKGRKVALCVSASVSAYKALDIVSLLCKLGAHVRVAMSEESKKFLSPLLFEALSHEAVLHDDAQSWAHDGL
ncbi:MAG: bifunctional phosphopantothenoylcysteine decarboxylase/phosphopantothenate--cysteine ligase CoaBC, partial [Helicobacter sp.]|nr:bifunctional phosphopantothenoylcysteine decarboxylase/phosphopantothenate--cysteine ligase CoaBC [Helicobacter sp.]